MAAAKTAEKNEQEEESFHGGQPEEPVKEVEKVDTAPKHLEENSVSDKYSEIQESPVKEEVKEVKEEPKPEPKIEEQATVVEPKIEPNSSKPSLGSKPNFGSKPNLGSKPMSFLERQRLAKKNAKAAEQVPTPSQIQN